MTLQGFLSLAWQTIEAPRDVARLLLSIRPSNEVLILSFCLVVVLNTLVAQIGPLLFASTSQGLLLGNPMVFLVMQAVSQAALILVVAVAGRMIGGRGRWSDVAVLMLWLYALRVLLVVGITALSLISTAIADLVLIVATVVGIWLTLVFVDEAHGLGGLFKAAGVLFLGLLGLSFILSILLALLGVTPEGLILDV